MIYANNKNGPLNYDLLTTVKQHSISCLLNTWFPIWLWNRNFKRVDAPIRLDLILTISYSIRASINFKRHHNNTNSMYPRRLFDISCANQTRFFVGYFWNLDCLSECLGIITRSASVFFIFFVLFFMLSVVCTAALPTLWGVFVDRFSRPNLLHFTYQI